MVLLACMHADGKGVEQDIGKPVLLLQEAIQHGCAGAISNLGVLYENGVGVPQDYDMAIQLYERASDQGEVVAMWNIGHLYERGGSGCAPDYAKARHYYQMALNEAIVVDNTQWALSFNMEQACPKMTLWQHIITLLPQLKAMLKLKMHSMTFGLRPLVNIS